MTTTETKLLTADDLLRLDGRGVRGELIRGVLCETMSTGQRHGKIVMNLGIELGTFIKPRQLGTLVGSDSGVWLERDPDTVREPDIAFTSVDRLPLDEDVRATPRSCPTWWSRSSPRAIAAARSTTRRGCG